jgi:ubiquinone biosynthesis protein
LILSALIVGSSLAILADKGPQLWGVPAIGLIGFVFSAVLGAYLIIKYMIEND